jgi:hypothetical protein
MPALEGEFFESAFFGFILKTSNQIPGIASTRVGFGL